MQKEWSSLRLTFILYAIVLVIPLAFYSVYTSFSTAQDDTKAIRQIGEIGGISESIAIAPFHQYDEKMVKNVDETLNEISVWVTQNNKSKFYKGKQTLSKDFSNVVSCWTAHKKKLVQSNKFILIDRRAPKCSLFVKDLANIIEIIVYQKEKKLINMFYWNLAGAMFLSFLMIYLVRTYIQMQMKKHAIYDHETKLFNKKYFLAALRSVFSTARRHENPLSISFVSLNDFANDTYSKHTKEKLLIQIGKLFNSILRESDISSRYDENLFAILLPLTDKSQAFIMENRLKEILEKHDFKVAPKVNFSFATTQLEINETEEEFISRTKNLLK